MGENILIVHGGGPTSVINASLYGAVEEAKKYKEIEHIYAAKNGTGGLMREELIELENVPDEKLELLLNTPGSAIGTSRDQIEQAEYDRMIEVLLKKNIKYVLFNGGNGSMDTCGKLYKNCQARGLDIRVMGIPSLSLKPSLATTTIPLFFSRSFFTSSRNFSSSNGRSGR
jgi:ATP-dependent phosphofructokinase / diphosphate-dependent phosphofructokinase